MRVMVIVKATKDSEAGVMPSEQLLTEMGNYNQELMNAGILQGGEGLHPSAAGVRVRFSGNDKSVIPGPFDATGELIAGFWLWKVKSMEEAVDWVKRCPFDRDTELEIRPVFETEEFTDMTPEARAQEERLRAELESR